MLEEIDLTKAMNKKDYKKEMSSLEHRLESLQHKIKEYKVPVLIVFEGWSASGKGTLIGKVLSKLDPRLFNVITMDKPNEDSIMRPFLWSFAKNMPSAGRITIFDKSWHRMVMPDSLKKRSLSETEKNGFYYDVNAFENQLAHSGTLIIKLFLHISKDEQKKRFLDLEKSKDTKWRVDEGDLIQNKEYDKNLKLFDQMLERSNHGTNFWSVVEANDKNFATVKIYKIIINKIEEEIKRRSIANQLYSKKPNIEVEQPSILGKIEPDKEISDTEYKEKLTYYQNKISYLGYKLYTKRRPVIIAYEGWDAAGKGGNIKRITQELDPRGYEVIPVSAPTEEELNHNYLWRFWKNLPKDGHISIFDRTWYGRVMVERIENFCTTEEWQRAYKEINDFELHLHNHGTIIFKFWLHIDKDEQLKRFKARQEDALKQYKITDEDWRNREKWDVYEKAVDEMLYLTNTSYAPWVVVESNSKKFARIKTLEIVTGELEKRLK